MNFLRFYHFCLQFWNWIQTVGFNPTVLRMDFIRRQMTIDTNDDIFFKRHYTLVKIFILITILFFSSCTSPYTIRKSSIQEKDFVLIGAVLVNQDDAKYGINFSSIDKLKLVEMDSSKGNVIGNEISANEHSNPSNDQEEYLDIPLSGLSHSVYFSWSSLENFKCYAISQIGYSITSQVPIGNGFYRTYSSSHDTRIDPTESYEKLPLCVKKGIQFYGILGVDKNGNIYNVIDSKDILNDSAKNRIFNSNDHNFMKAEKTAMQEFTARVKD